MKTFLAAVGFLILAAHFVHASAIARTSNNADRAPAPPAVLNLPYGGSGGWWAIWIKGNSYTVYNRTQVLFKVPGATMHDYLTTGKP